MFKSSHNSKTLSQGKKSDLEGGLPTIELPEWWDLLSLSLKVFLASARNLVVVFLPWKAWGKSVSASWRRHCDARSQVELHLSFVNHFNFFPVFFNHLRRLTCSVCCCVVINLDWDNISISRSILVLIIAYLVIDCRICHFSSNSETTCALFVFCAIFLQSELGLRGI